MSQPTLTEQLRELKYQHRLDQASLVAEHHDPDERAKAAASIIRQIALQRIFDQLTKQQETELFDRLWQLAYPEAEVARPACFGNNSFSRIDCQPVTMFSSTQELLEKRLGLPLITADVPTPTWFVAHGDETWTIAKHSRDPNSSDPEVFFWEVYSSCHESTMIETLVDFLTCR